MKLLFSLVMLRLVGMYSIVVAFLVALFDAELW